MSTFKDTSHFLLYCAKKHLFFKALFESSGRQMHVDSTLGFITRDELDEMISLDIVDLFHDEVLLNDPMVEVLETYLTEGRDTELYDYRALFKKMENSIVLYRKDRENGLNYERHLRTINSQLRKMPRNLRAALESIQYRIEFVYKGALTSEQKREELTLHRESLDQIDSVMTFIKTELRKQARFFSEVQDSFIIHQYHRLQEYMWTAYDTLIGTIETVFDYIQKIEDDRRFYEHIVMLKELRDSSEILDKTNLYDLTSESKGILARGFTQVERRSSQMKLDIDYASDDEFVAYVINSHTEHDSNDVVIDKAEPIEAYYLDGEEETVVDYSGILFEYLEDADNNDKAFLEYLAQREPELNDEALLSAYMGTIIANRDELSLNEGQFERIGAYDCIRVTPREYGT